MPSAAAPPVPSHALGPNAVRLQVRALFYNLVDFPPRATPCTSWPRQRCPGRCSPTSDRLAEPEATAAPGMRTRQPSRRGAP